MFHLRTAPHQPRPPQPPQCSAHSPKGAKRPLPCKAGLGAAPAGGPPPHPMAAPDFQPAALPHQNSAGQPGWLAWRGPTRRPKPPTKQATIKPLDLASPAPSPLLFRFCCELEMPKLDSTTPENSSINFCKNVIKVSPDEIKEHQNFLKKSLKKNYF